MKTGSPIRTASVAAWRISKYIPEQPAIWRVAPPEDAAEGSPGTRPAAKREMRKPRPRKAGAHPEDGEGSGSSQRREAHIVTNPSPDQGQAECYCLNSKVSRKTDKKTQFVPFFGCPADVGKRQGFPCGGARRGFKVPCRSTRKRVGPRVALKNCGKAKETPSSRPGPPSGPSF